MSIRNDRILYAVEMPSNIGDPNDFLVITYPENQSFNAHYWPRIFLISGENCEELPTQAWLSGKTGNFSLRVQEGKQPLAFRAVNGDFEISSSGGVISDDTIFTPATMVTQEKLGAAIKRGLIPGVSRLANQSSLLLLVPAPN